VIKEETGNEMVTNIRVGVTARESLRRQEERKRKELWKVKEDDEKEKSNEILSRILGEWRSLDSCKGPYQMAEVQYT
jgi:dynein regulatory complex protein 1